MNDLDLTMLGVPIQLLAVSESVAELTVSTIAPPDGQTFVVDGIDWSFSATGASQAIGYFNNDGGYTLWQGWTPLAPVIFGGGLSWRGHWPLYPGEVLIVAGFVSPLGGGVGLSAWGRALPYVPA